MKKIAVSIIWIFLFTFFVFSQKAPAKFGSIDKSLLEMTVYDKDSSAPAVIVCNYGYFRANDLRFTRLLRIKILNKNGYSYANRSYEIDGTASVRGITYNLENGEVVKSKLKNESIYKERLYQNFVLANIAMPNVKVGSVIDLEYSFLGLPNSWEFQEKIPVMHSELVIEPSQYLRFKKNFFGYEMLKYSTDSWWVAENVPAFKPEPYINSVDNYITKFEINLLDVNFPGYYESFSTKWEVVGQHLLEDENFGGTFGPAFYLNSLVDEIKATGKKGEELLGLAVNAVKRIKWNNICRTYTSSTSLGQIYKNQVGNSADINLILVQLLRKLDLKASPVVLSTKDNGYITTYSVNQNRLNYVLAHVKLDEKSYLLDATEKYLPYNMLPTRCLNGQGLKIEENKVEWVDLKSNKKNKEVHYYEFSMKDDLSLEGKISNSYSDYSGFDFRKEFTGYNSEQEYVDNYIKSKPGLQMKDYKISGIDSLSLPVKEEYSVIVENQLEEIGNEFYLFPFLFEQMKENPFRTEERKYPVDYDVPLEKSFVAKYIIPEGFSIVKLPSNQIKKTADNGASFIYSVSNMNNTIQVTFRLLISKTTFLADEYPILRELYNQIIKSQAEPIILKRI